MELISGINLMKAIGKRRQIFNKHMQFYMTNNVVGVGDLVENPSLSDSNIIRQNYFFLS